MIHEGGACVDDAEEVTGMRARIWAVLVGLTLMAMTAVPAFADKGVIWGS